MQGRCLAGKERLSPKTETCCALREDLMSLVDWCRPTERGTKIIPGFDFILRACPPQGAGLSLSLLLPISHLHKAMSASLKNGNLYVASVAMA